MDDAEQLEAAIRRASAEEILPLVYTQLRDLARQRLRHESPGHTLQATALVHEAYLRIGGGTGDGEWDGRGHYFAAASEAMRRILVDRARANATLKRGGNRARLDLTLSTIALDEVPAEIIDLDEALSRLAMESADGAQLVQLRFFAGLTMSQAAEVLDMSLATAERRWFYARAWLFAAMNDKI